MQSTNQPGKFLIPFAQNDSAKVEIPATSADPTRMSQSLGSPPLTGMPPEAGGVPPQLEDFNGAMNQVARIPWWLMAGARFGFDAAWSGDPAIGGYPRGAVLPAALGVALVGMGEWYSNAEDNTADPDVSGAGWVPGYHYGSTALTGQTGGTVTLTPAQAAKRVLTIAGTLTSNLVLVVPGWVYDWTVYNNTGGAFTVTIKNSGTPGVIVPQNGAPTPVRCDGNAVSLFAPNIGPATSSTQGLQLGQATGRVVRTTVYGRDVSNAQVVAVDGGTATTTGATTFTAQAGTRLLRIRVVGGGGGGGGAQGTAAGQQSAAAGGAGGGYAESIIAPPGSATTVTVGLGGAGAPAGLVGGTAGGQSSFGSLLIANGGGGGFPGAQTAGSNVVGTAAGGTATGGTIVNTAGQPGGVAMIVALGAVSSGPGAPGLYGGAGAPVSNASGAPARGPGAGGSGGACYQSTAGGAGGGAGGPGYIEVVEYA